MESVVRLKPGISIRQADNELRALTDRLGRDFPATNRGWSARTVPLQQEVIGFFRLALFAVFGAAGLLLLVACFNVANLLLARATLRAPEVAVRTAIGAGRARLVRQFLTESALLAVVGAALGVVVALVAIRLVVVASPIAIPRMGGVGIDVRALLFAASTTGLTSLVFGIVPALALARGDVTRSLKGSRTTAHGHRTLSVLVVAEVALAVVLLCGAGLLVRTVRNLTAERPGFAPDGLFTTNLELPYTYSDWSRIARFYTDLADELRRRPGISASGSSAFLPLAAGWRMRFLIGGQPQPPPGEEPIAQTHIVDEGYFACLRVPLIDGRAFDARDTAERPGVVVINQAMARRYWPDQRAIGQPLNYGGKYMQIGPLGRTLVKELRFEVIGIVGDVKNTALDSAPEPAIYFTVRQFSYRNLNIVVRGSAPQAALESTVRAAVRQMDQDLPLSSMRSMDRVLAASVDPTRMLTALMAAFAALAVLLAGIGLYGILAYAVGQRRRELSVRLALGAEPASLRSMVIGHGLRLVAAGCLAGAAGAYGVGRALSGFLFGVAPSDARTIGGVMVILIVVGLAASARPAQRAAAIDPLEGLRSE
jgi:predicted permease